LNGLNAKLKSLSVKRTFLILTGELDLNRLEVGFLLLLLLLFTAHFHIGWTN